MNLFTGVPVARVFEGVLRYSIFAGQPVRYVRDKEGREHDEEGKFTSTGKGGAKKSEPAKSKPAGSESHPLAGKSDAEAVKQLLSFGGPAGPAHMQADPWGLLTAKTSMSDKTKKAVVGAIQAQQKVNAFKRLTTTDLFQKMRDEQPDLTLKDFQAGLAQMAKVGDIALGPFTQALTQVPHPQDLIPLDREFKYYVGPGRSREQASGGPERYSLFRGRWASSQCRTTPAVYRRPVRYEFREEEHPRDKGKFSEKQGRAATISNPTGAAAATVDQFHTKAQKIVKEFASKAREMLVKFAAPAKYLHDRTDQLRARLIEKYGARNTAAIFAAGQVITWGISIGAPLATGLPIIVPPGGGLATSLVLAGLVDAYERLRGAQTEKYAMSEAALSAEQVQQEAAKLINELLAGVVNELAGR